MIGVQGQDADLGGRVTGHVTGVQGQDADLGGRVDRTCDRCSGAGC